MPQFNKHGNRIRASDKSLVFSFLCWFAASAVPCGSLAAEPKNNLNYELESNLAFSRWQRPFFGHII